MDNVMPKNRPGQTNGMLNHDEPYSLEELEFLSLDCAQKCTALNEEENMKGHLAGIKWAIKDVELPYLYCISKAMETITADIAYSNNDDQESPYLNFLAGAIHYERLPDEEVIGQLIDNASKCSYRSRKPFVPYQADNALERDHEFEFTSGFMTGAFEVWSHYQSKLEKDRRKIAST